MVRIVTALAGIAALLAGCVAPQASYFGQDFSAIYSRTEVASAAAQGPVPVLLRGNPFPSRAAQSLAEATLAGLASSARLYSMRLTSGDPGPRNVDYRFVVAFGQPRLGANGLCAAPDAPFEATQRLNATAAFCIGDRLVTTIRGRSHADISGPEDPDFHLFVRGLVDAMMPPVNPLLQDSRCRLLRGC